MKKPLIAFALFLTVGCSHLPFHRQTAMTQTAPMNPANQATIISIGGNQMFSPNNVTVRAGSPVYWKNSDHATHRIVLDDHRYDSSDIIPGAIGCGLILNDAGMHTYHDMNNPGATGTINVTQ
jgi:plastocyanin